MRIFYLVDEIGATFTFNHLTKALFTEVEGVGIERDNTYVNFDGTYKLVKRENPMGTISGKIIFLNGYAGYTEFLNFLKNCSGSLRLFYKADNLKYAYVELKSITKTELESGVLQCSTTFDKLSMWLCRTTNTIKVEENNLDKVYPYTYPYTYSKSFVGTMTFTNHSSHKAPIRLEITGKTENPIVEIYQKEKLISKMRLIVRTTNASDKIVVDAMPTEQEMSLTVGTKTTNIYTNQDFNFDNFLYLPVGSYTIRFEPGVTEKTTCKVTIIEMYEGN